jgi:hypothetical protein
MTSMTSATEGMGLYCYTEGEPEIFSVSISPSDTIEGLKNEIYKKGVLQVLRRM